MVADRKRVQAEIDRLGFDLPMAVTTGNLMDLIAISGVPTTLFVSREGRIVAIAEGALSEDALDSAIQAIAGS